MADVVAWAVAGGLVAIGSRSAMGMAAVAVAGGENVGTTNAKQSQKDARHLKKAKGPSANSAGSRWASIFDMTAAIVEHAGEPLKQDERSIRFDGGARRARARSLRGCGGHVALCMVACLWCLVECTSRRMSHEPFVLPLI